MKHDENKFLFHFTYNRKVYRNNYLENLSLYTTNSAVVGERLRLVVVRAYEVLPVALVEHGSAGRFLDDRRPPVACRGHEQRFADEGVAAIFYYLCGLKQSSKERNMSLFDTVSEAIKPAMLARDKVRLEALRGIKKEFIEARTAPGSGGELTDEAALKILTRMVKQRRESAQIYTEQDS